MGLFDTLSKYTEGLSKTRISLIGRVQKLITAQSKIDDATFNELEQILLEADVGFATTSEILTRLRHRVKEERFEDTSALLALLKEVVLEILGPQSIPSMPPAELRPFVIMVVGVNGAGKRPLSEKWLTSTARQDIAS